LHAQGQLHWSLGQAFNFLLLLTTKTDLLSMVVSFTSKVVSSELDDEDDDSEVSEADEDDSDC